MGAIVSPRVVLHVTSGLGIGGAEAFLTQVASALQARGVPQYVVCIGARRHRDSTRSQLIGSLHLIGIQLKRSRQIKARVFEVPGAGGALLTQVADGLSDYFHVGLEIDTFDRLDGLAAKAKYYLMNPIIRDRLAWAGHKRIIAEHTYDRRFGSLLDYVHSNVAPERRQRPWRIDAGRLQTLIDRHRNTKTIRPLRLAIEAIARALVGRERDARAARRVVFEASWRMAGKRTFSAAGLPGRLFFRES